MIKFSDLVKDYSEIENRIIDINLSHVEVAANPVAVATMGASGAGKTTLLYALSRACNRNISSVGTELGKINRLGKPIAPLDAISGKPFKDAVYINTDDIKRTLASFDEVLDVFGIERGISADEALSQIYARGTDDELVVAFHKQANRISEKIVMACMKDKKSFVFDTTFGEVGEAENEADLRKQLMQMLAQQGYQQFILPMEMDSETAQTRFNKSSKPYNDIEQVKAYIENYPERLAQVRAICASIGENSPTIIEFVSKDNSITPTNPVSKSTETHQNFLQQKLAELAQLLQNARDNLPFGLRRK